MVFILTNDKYPAQKFAATPSSFSLEISSGTCSGGRASERQKRKGGSCDSPPRPVFLLRRNQARITTTNTMKVSTGTYSIPGRKSPHSEIESRGPDFKI